MAIRVLENRLFFLDTENTSYGMGIDAKGVLRHLYFGPRLERMRDFLPELDRAVFAYGSDRVMEEFSSFGCLRNKETSLRQAYGDRTRDFRYTVSEYKCEDEQITFMLRDMDYEYAAELKFCIYPEQDMLERGVTLHNIGEDMVAVHRIFSMELALPGDGYHLLNTSGLWAMEQQAHADLISGGKKVYESVLGTTGFSAQPCFAAYQQADEQKGDVYFGCLSYSGNFKVVAESVPYGYLNVLMGMNDTDFALPLSRGQRFEAPKAYLGFTNQGLGGMSRRLHRFARERLMPASHRDQDLPVLYNSWYATEFQVRGEEQEKLAEKAAMIGVELFVIDDGWFGRRENDRAGLGDWYVNPEKFPQGLDHLIDKVHGLGMRFGLWIEPEMTNPDSDLYRAHPDWIYAYPRRKPITGRNQYALNLTKPEVAAYLIDVFDKLLSSYDIDYVKWDMNRFLAEALDAQGMDGLVWHHHTQGFLHIAQALRERHPKVAFEACAGGGARVNYETLSVFDQFWPSDNTHPLDRCAIQHGYSLFYPPRYMRAWVTDDAQTPVDFRAKCAMCGALGIGSNLNTCSKEELQALQAEIALYKQIRPLVQSGALYRLKSMKADAVQAWEYVNPEEAAVIVLLDHQAQTRPLLRLEGLDEAAVYRLNEGEQLFSGGYLMHHGLPIQQTHEREGKVWRLKKIKENEA